MIFQLTGQLVAKNGLLIVIDVQGVGYGLYAPASTLLKLPRIGEQVFLHTHVVVREDSQVLYGFYSEPERFLFAELIKIAGFGPKLSLSILSHLGVEQFLHTIRLQDVTKLIKIPGVGKKMAQRLMIEMQNNIDTKRYTEFFQTVGVGCSKDAVFDLANHITSDVQEALMSLGYNSKEAILAVRSAEKSLQDRAKDVTISSEILLRTCLKFLSKVHHD